MALVLSEEWNWPGMSKKKAKIIKIIDNVGIFTGELLDNEGTDDLNPTLSGKLNKRLASNRLSSFTQAIFYLEKHRSKNRGNSLRNQT